MAFYWIELAWSARGIIHSWFAFMIREALIRALQWVSNTPVAHSQMPHRRWPRGQLWTTTSLLINAFVMVKTASTWATPNASAPWARTLNWNSYHSCLCLSQSSWLYRVYNINICKCLYFQMSGCTCTCIAAMHECVLRIFLLCSLHKQLCIKSVAFRHVKCEWVPLVRANMRNLQHAEKKLDRT